MTMVQPVRGWIDGNPLVGDFIVKEQLYLHLMTMVQPVRGWIDGNPLVGDCIVKEQLYLHLMTMVQPVRGCWIDGISPLVELRLYS